MFSVSPDIPLKNKISITDGTIEGKSMKRGPLLNYKKKEIVALARTLGRTGRICPGY